MHCKYCGVEVESDTFVCPLCHEKMEIDDTVLPINGLFPPKRKKQAVRKKISVFTWYCFIALVLFVVSVAIDFAVTDGPHWSYAVGAGIVYGAFLIKFVIMARSSVGVRVFWQLIAMTVTGLIFGVVFNEFDIVIKYVLPSIIMVSIIVQSSFSVFYAKRKRSIFLSSMVISLLGFVPIILYACKVESELWLAIASAVLGAGALIGNIVFGNKKIAFEVQKRYHW